MRRPRPGFPGRPRKDVAPGRCSLLLRTRVSPPKKNKQGPGVLDIHPPAFPRRRRRPNTPAPVLYAAPDNAPFHISPEKYRPAPIAPRERSAARKAAATRKPARENLGPGRRAAASRRRACDRAVTLTSAELQLRQAQQSVAGAGRGSRGPVLVPGEKIAAAKLLPAPQHRRPRRSFRVRTALGTRRVPLVETRGSRGAAHASRRRLALRGRASYRSQSPWSWLSRSRFSLPPHTRTQKRSNKKTGKYSGGKQKRRNAFPPRKQELFQFLFPSRRRF